MELVFPNPPPPETPLRAAIRDAHRLDESATDARILAAAEALLRIPDSETVDRLIRDKIAPADWQRHLGHSGSLFVNASTWALMLTGRLLRPDHGEGDLGNILRRFVARSS